MAVQFFDGFDDYGGNNAALLSQYQFRSGPNNYFGTIAGVFGGTALGNNNPNDACIELLRAVPTPKMTIIAAARIYCGGTGIGGFTFSDASGEVIAQVAIGLGGPTTTITATKNGGNAPVSVLSGTPLGSSSPFASYTGLWRGLGAQLTAGSGTSGSLIVYVDGNAVLSLTGIDTQGTAGSPIAYVGPFIGGLGYFDDFVILDTTGPAPWNTFPSITAGPMGLRSSLLVPNSDGTMQMTPSTGTLGYPMVNKTSYATTPNLKASAAGEVAQFGLPTLNMLAIAAVQTSYVAQIDDAGIIETNGQIIINGAATNGATNVNTANPTKYVDLYLTDPTTGVAWNPSRFSTAGQVEVGVERTV